MKLIIQSLTASTLIHIIYFLSTMIIGFIKTVTYIPSNENHNISMLQNETAFGYVVSPWVFLVTFVGVALMFGLFLSLVRRSKRTDTQKI